MYDIKFTLYQCQYKIATQALIRCILPLADFHDGHTVQAASSFQISTVQLMYIGKLISCNTHVRYSYSLISDHHQFQNTVLGSQAVPDS